MIAMDPGVLGTSDGSIGSWTNTRVGLSCVGFIIVGVGGTYGIVVE